MFESGGSASETKFYNNICLGKQEISVGTDDYNAIASKMSKNGWTNHLVTGIGMDDFVSLDEDDALKPRSIDGSLPRRFGRLASDSKMVDAGNADYDIPADLIADFPFLKRTITGKGRDLGPYERGGEAVDAIEEIEAFEAGNNTMGDGKIYNLNGQQVMKPSKGIYIVNGKKVLK